ncbi:DUF116 domain-containing protein [Methanobacterium sp. ACI-7]|uniref:DUF116 domain-containing protein n=1 Tax=unclassified Methanobacterium TaxID=2627676 RepID=UPI0039C1768D
MEITTYSLKLKENNSNQYYEDVRIFTDEVLREFESFETHVISDFMDYLKENDARKIRTCEEYIFEFLMLGIFWKIYSRRALSLDENPSRVLENLVEERNKNLQAKETIDIIRGVLMKPFLLSESVSAPDLTLENFQKLLMYLKSTGDFNQELRRLKIWNRFFETENPKIVSKHLQNALLFVNWFEDNSKQVLGKYTIKVNKFLAEKYVEHHWREDVIFCGRKEVEYHLNMVGAEIMNRAYKNEFSERPRKALLLPGCMRISQVICKAEETDLGLKCGKCMKNCNVDQLTDMGIKYGFEVYIISHESSAFSKSTKVDRDELGIVGVACVSNLIAGGWKSDSLGIPAQCVLLDSASCKNHWHKTGIPTNININHLMDLFNIKTEEYYKLGEVTACH